MNWIKFYLKLSVSSKSKLNFNLANMFSFVSGFSLLKKETKLTTLKVYVVISGLMRFSCEYFRLKIWNSGKFDRKFGLYIVGVFSEETSKFWDGRECCLNKTFGGIWAIQWHWKILKIHKNLQKTTKFGTQKNKFEKIVRKLEF